LKIKDFKIKIILVEPEGPINVGSIARLCANFAVDQLRIVSPKCDIFSLESVKMSLKGFSYIEELNLYKSLNEAISDCDLVLATCGRTNNAKDANHYSLGDISNWIKASNKINNLAIVFGRETIGLTNKELLLAHRVFSIDTNKNYPSLNLSHAVSIVLYELNKCSNEYYLEKNKTFNNIASINQIEESFFEIEELLLKIGYLFSHTSNAKISKFKKYILRAQTSDHEINILRGIIHQINWALKHSKNN
tara:strand:- start:17837 stop:18583 length:747 start_codon:yes stop_codon:yes gene_type:complete